MYVVSAAAIVMGSTLYSYKSFELYQSICTRKFLPGLRAGKNMSHKHGNFATIHIIKDVKIQSLTFGMVEGSLLLLPGLIPNMDTNGS